MTMHHHQILGPVIRRLREMALRGCAPTQMRDYLWAKSPDHVMSAFTYLGDAVLQFSMQFTGRMMGSDLFPELDADITRRIMEKRAELEAQPFPELMRLEDYFAFSRFASDEKLTVFVCA